MKRTTIRFTDAQYEELLKQATKAGLSMAELVRNAVTHKYLPLEEYNVHHTPLTHVKDATIQAVKKHLGGGGRYIPAIQLVREAESGLGLWEAKSIVDQIELELPKS